MILRDIFPQWAVDLQILKKDSPQYKILHFFENLQYETADIVGIQTEGNRSHFKRMPNISKKIRVLKNWYGSDSLDTDLPIEILRQIPKNKKILLYAGNLGIAQDQELVLKIIDKMQDQDEFIFLFVGLKDSDKSSVLDYVENQKLHNLIMLDSLDHKYMNALCQQCFIGIFCLDKRHTTQNIPGKFLQYLSSGLPVFGLCGPGDIVDLIYEKGLGKTYMGNSYDEAVDLINGLSNDIDSGRLHLRALKEYINNELSTKSAINEIKKSMMQ